MRNSAVILFIIFSLWGTNACATEESLQDGYPVKPVTFNKVELSDNFWLPRINKLIEVTVPHALKETNPAVKRLRLCGQILDGKDVLKPQTHRFISSDLFKVMEGAAYSLMINPDPKLEKRLDRIIDIIADAQQKDGYLYVSHICDNPNPDAMGKTPYSYVVHSHELYNMGHMYEAAIAYYRATGKDKWLKVAEKNAKHINKVFFEGAPNYNDGNPVMQAPGHEEIELALCKLYRVTGNELYLQMAKKFLDIRGVTYRPEGEGVMSPTYAQQHKPVVKQKKAVGHAVRAGYLYSGMSDVSALTGDMSYAKAAERIWHNVVDTKMHIIGGLGAVHGIEGFGPEYVLPNKDTYNETCAAIANVFFNFRMFLLHGDAKYFDVAEVALFNNALVGINLKGDRFFYVNVLEADGETKFNHGSAGRKPWFGCACCPSNLARLIPQVSGYMYAHTNNEIFVTLYAGNSTQISLQNGKVGINQQTKYPFDGKVNLSLSLASPQRFTLKLRIPTWARKQFVPGELYDYARDLQVDWTVKINGNKVEPELKKGFAVITRRWKDNDTVELDIPMPVRFNTCIDKVKSNANRVAVTRGPLVYCAEEVDNSRSAQRLTIPQLPETDKISTSVIEEGILENIVRISLPGKDYRPAKSIPASIEQSVPAMVNLIPYYAWNNRGEKSMRVWFPQDIKTSEESTPADR